MSPYRDMERSEPRRLSWLDRLVGMRVRVVRCGDLPEPMGLRRWGDHPYSLECGHPQTCFPLATWVPGLLARWVGRRYSAAARRNGFVRCPCCRSIEAHEEGKRWFAEHIAAEAQKAREDDAELAAVFGEDERHE